jgi:tRNA pseudouridine55 synthase
VLEAETKEVTIKALKLLGVEGCEAEFELCCSAGTYARSLAHDVGHNYGCGAHLAQLRRTRSGGFPIEAAKPLAEGEKFFSREFFCSHIIPMRDLLPELPAIRLSPGDHQKIMHGMDLNLLTSAWDAREFRLLDENDALIAVAQRLQVFASPVAQPVRWVRIHPRINLCASSGQ